MITGKNSFLDLLQTEQQQHKVTVQLDAKEDLGLSLTSPAGKRITMSCNCWEMLQVR